MIKAQRGIECSNVNCDVPFCDGTFPGQISFFYYSSSFFFFVNGCMDESIWMGKEAEGWGSPKNAINSTHFILPHTLPIYSLNIVLYISAENPLGHCGSTSVPLEHIKAYLKWVFELKCFVSFFFTILIAIITLSNCVVSEGNLNILFFCFAHDHLCLGYSKYPSLWNPSQQKCYV